MIDDPPRAAPDAANEIVGLYRRHAVAWTTARGEHLIESAWLDRFVDVARAHGAVLDLGCGSGLPIARELVRRGLAVVGIDSAPEMIARFQANLPGQDAKVGDMRALDLGRRFEGVIAWDSFFHLRHDDQRAMFPIFARHSAPGGALMFTSGPSFGEAIGMLEGEPLYHASLSGEEYRALLADAGFEVVAQKTKDPDCGGRTVWLARRR